MLRLLHFSLLILFCSSGFSQSITPLKSSKYIGVTEMVFDEDNNRYIIGRYKGNPYFLNLSESSSMTAYIAKLDPNNNIVWSKPINTDRQRYNLSLQNNKLYVLARTQESDYDKGIRISTAFIESFDMSSGNLISDQQVAKMEGKGAFIDGEFMDGGVFIRATIKGDKETFVLNDATLNKKKYSAVVFQKYNLSGEKLWEHQIEGGFNGFTDIRVGDVDFDKSGNAYVLSYFSESLELGNASYSTDIHFEHKTLPLYYNGSFLLKLNEDGTPGKSIDIAKYQIDFEKIHCDDDRIYILGYYRGNKAYAEELEGNQTPVVFMGKTLNDCPISPGTKQPSENLLVACIDYDFNLLWHFVGSGTGNTRAKSLCLSGDAIYIAGTSSSDVDFGSHKIDGFGSDGYSDAYILKLTKDGEILNSKAFHGPGSISAKIFSNSAGDVVSTIYFNKDYVIINGEKIERFSGSANELIYDFKGKSKPVQTNSGNSELKVGDRVEGNWKGQGRYYPGKIGKIDGSKYYIQYDDGDVEWTTKEYIRKK